MKNKIMMAGCLSLMSLMLATAATPANAQATRRVEWTGERGGRANTESTYERRPGGGVNVQREGRTVGPNGGEGFGSTRIETDGNGNATFRGGGSGVGPRGNNANWDSEGTGRVNRQTGRYEGQRRTTVNGRTYESTTENGRTTVTGPNGRTRVYTRPWAR